MEPNINYPDLQEDLKKIGLILREHKQHKTIKGVAFEALVESETAPVMISKRLAVYQNLRASGRTPNEVAREIFSLMTTSIIVLIGTYDDYKEKVVYKDGSFKRVPLSKEELIDINCPL